MAEDGKSFIKSVSTLLLINLIAGKFQGSISRQNRKLSGNRWKYPVIEALDGQLITNRLQLTGKEINGEWVSDPEQDILRWWW